MIEKHSKNSHDNTISHDPATYQAPVASKYTSKSKKSVLILTILGLILVIIGGIWYFNGKSFDFTKSPEGSFEVTEFDDSAIAIVGAEQIFAEDLNVKLRQFPEDQRENLKENFTQQLIDESIILQAGAELNYIELSSEVFNSPTKNQEKRSLLVEEVKDAVNRDAANIEGAYVTIWFNNFKPGPLGYEAGKEFALQKITTLHQAVKSGQMTIAQAGKAIQDDSTLAGVDPQYQSNAYIEFDSKNNVGGLTFQPEFDQELLALNVGETTDVFTGQDYVQADFTKDKIDALYMFGQVTNKSEGSEPYDTWFNTQKEKYEVTI